MRDLGIKSREKAEERQPESGLVEGFRLGRAARTSVRYYPHRELAGGTEADVVDSSKTF